MHRRITGRLVIATHNPGKLAEMRELLAPYGIEAISAGELGLPDQPRLAPEHGDTFRETRRGDRINSAVRNLFPKIVMIHGEQSHSPFRDAAICSAVSPAPTNASAAASAASVKSPLR